MKLKTLGILDTDKGSLDEAVAWLSIHTPGYRISIQATSWGKLLTNSSFPPNIVLLRFRTSDRVDISYETRFCRIIDLEAIVLVDEQNIVFPNSVGARIVHGLGEVAAALDRPGV